MTKTKSTLNVFLMLIIFVLHVSNAKAASVTVISPNGGECLRQGDTVTITWTMSNVNHAALYYTTDGGATTPNFGGWFFMFNSGDPSTSYDWTVPVNIDSSSVRIWVEGHDAGHTQRLAIDSSDSNLMIKPACTDTTPPTISITFPVNGSTLSGTSNTITAAASDNVGVVGVQFKVDSQNLGLEATTSPYFTSLDTTGIADGTHAITAVARDAAGNTATSSAISVNVSNADTTPPIISSVSSSFITASSATITWTTNENSDSQVDYGPASSYGSSTALNTTLAVSHFVALSSLTSGTTYHYRVRSKDAAGNLATSNDFTFTTTAIDTTPPMRSGGLPAGTLASGTTLINLTLNTDEAATCKYSVTPNTAYSSMTGTFAITGGTSHSTLIGGLANGSLNYYVRCTDTTGNANTDDFAIAFVIPNSVDIDPPVMSFISSSFITASNATITWATNENSDSQVDYGSTSSYGSSTALNTTLATSHSVSLRGLLPFTIYHYRVKSRDAAGNIAISGDYIFTTLGAPLPVVLIVSPTNSSTVSGTISIIATATDNAGVTGVQFKIDGNNFGSEETISPYSISWDTTKAINGTHTLVAVARNTAGNLAESNLTVIVLNAPNAEKSNLTKLENPNTVQLTINKNIISLKLDKIDAGLSVDLPINDNRTVVNKLTVEVKNSVASVEFKIEDLASDPVNITPSKSVYKYFELNKSIADISKATVSFKVPLSWIKNNNIKENEIVLFHYKNNLWEYLATSKVGVEEGNVVFKATTTGFSAFAIGVNQPTKLEATSSGQNKTPVRLWIYITAISLPIAALLGFVQISVAKNRKREEKMRKLSAYFYTNLKKGYTLQQIKDNLIKYKFDSQDIEEAIRTLDKMYAKKS